MIIDLLNHDGTPYSTFDADTFKMTAIRLDIDEMATPDELLCIIEAWSRVWVSEWFNDGCRFLALSLVFNGETMNAITQLPPHLEGERDVRRMHRLMLARQMAELLVENR